MRGLIGKKIGMTRIFNSSGHSTPVTVLEAGPCHVTQIKTVKNDGYDAVQLGFLELKEKHTNKPLGGHFKKNNVAPAKVLAEFQSVPKFEYKLGQTFNVSLFSEGDFVSVSGKSKGRGFSGTIKNILLVLKEKHMVKEIRTGMLVQLVLHQTFKSFPGKKMPGRYGHKTVSIKGLEVISVSEDRNQLLVKGSVPGAINGIVYIMR